MKRRLLSAFLVVCMMLTMIPSVAFAADGEGEPGTTLPPETCTVEYKEQSEGVEYIGYEQPDENEEYYIFNYVIHDSVSGDLVIDLAKGVLDVWENESQMPGDKICYQINIQNDSGKTYAYKDNSFVIAPEDTEKLAELLDSSMLPVLTYDGQHLPLKAAGAMIPEHFYKDIFQVEGSADVTFKMMCDIYTYLEKAGYSGDHAISNYLLTSLNEKYGTSYTSLVEMVGDNPGRLTEMGFTSNGIFENMPKDVLNQYIEEYPWVAPYIVTKDNGDNVDVQIKWPEGDVAAASYNAFYNGILSAVFGTDKVEQLDTTSQGTEFFRAHGVGRYSQDAALYGETNQFFQELTTGGVNDGQTISFEAAYGISGPDMGNAYQNYTFTFYNVIELEEVKPLEPGEGNWQVSKSKTATPLDSNYQSKVTLSLPSREEELVSDVVFVLDKSTSAELQEEAIQMLNELQKQVEETGAKVKVGVVIFNKQANEAFALNELNAETLPQIEEAIRKEISSGTNTHAGLLAGKAMLDADETVAANRKYLVFVSDGITYMYGEEPTITSEGYWGNDGSPYYSVDPYSWSFKYGTNNPPADWNAWIQQVGELIKNDTGEFDYPYDQKDSLTGGKNWGESDPSTYLMSVDKALYKTYEVYRAAQEAGYRCYTMNIGTATEYSWGPSFVKYLGGNQDVNFESIKNDIYYALDAGSRVEDVIGYGTDDKGAEYNFDFVVEDPSDLQLTVGKVPYSVEVSTGEKLPNETNRYLFKKEGIEATNGAEAPFVLHYYENGKDGDPDECFVWDINVPVSNFAPVQLTYTVELTNPSEVSGTHGQYDEDGHDEAGNPQYDSLKTNLEAILYPVDSNDTAGRPEKFYTPTVSYNVGAISIEPADITIYTGGEGYESAVEGSGDSEVGKTSNGLPEPGFYITLPADVNQALIEKADPDDVTEVEIEQEDGTTVKQDVVDLSKYLKFTYEDEEGNERLWELERYDNQQGNTSMAYSRYIYRIKPSTIQGGEPIPIRLQFTDEENNISITDDFEVNLDGLYQTYKMTIYAGDLNQGLVKAVVTVPGQEAEEYQAEVLEGDLTIRGVTDQNTMTTDVVKDENGPTEAVEDITAHVPEEAKFHINESQLEVADPNRVKLLVDSIVEDENNTLHNDAIDEFAEITADHNVQLNYLDLVDESNGNAWVTTDKPITVYWPYPEGTDKNDDFYIVHYEGLDRNDNEALENGAYTMELYSKENGNLETTDQGIQITVGSFSPFALFWEEDDIPVIDEPDGGDEDPIRYTLTYVSNGGTEYDPERYNANTVVQIDKQPIREGYTFEGWYLDEELTEPVDEVKMTRNITVYAKWEPTSVPGDLNGDDHFAYIIGRDDGYIHPTDNINRAEVAAIFFRLLKEDVRQANLTDTHSFNDVDADMWYNTSVATMAKMGIVTGDPDGSFRPEDSITRAEFAAIAARFDEIAYDGEDLFSDIAGHWAQEEINAAANNGWILGYTDGTFGPQKYITRAEAMTLVNRVLNRLPEDTSDLLDDMIRWPDNQDTNIWYYLAVQEATNSHDYERKSDGVHEKWTALNENEDWVKYQ